MITSHSLGGALASLVVVTFGASQKVKQIFYTQCLSVTSMGIIFDFKKESSIASWEYGDFRNFMITLPS
jgi:hypothetical protein